ncbi:hypothetical protein [Kitasatospora sp. GAS204B]|uniref:hypothetical protein n=1 Tax=unclassified Kitasatospora TaxID=2633591 RepID=UPI0024766869|nr:hypothetical protein [Kitasatospora sp. GAS204B]MDH6119334.1 hypothetical protein [Kitasatospora sp. GAS204B]
MDERILAMMAAVRSGEADRLVHAVHGMVDANPEVSGREVLLQLEALAQKSQEWANKTVVASEPDRDTCAKCGQPIETDSRDRERWDHSSDRSRGCRAADFTAEDGWNDEIPRSWVASPRKRRS